MATITRLFFISFLMSLPLSLHASNILVFMDSEQTDHLKAYGVAYWCLKRGEPVEWLLNYKGGAFLLVSSPSVTKLLNLRGVSYHNLSQEEASSVRSIVTEKENNMDLMRLEKAPKIAVYAPPGNLPWDDAVTLALMYAEIPYDKLWDEEVLNGDLSKYDWIHVHHEDFTGQFGKFYANFRHEAWYIKQVREAEVLARKLGFPKVSDQKKAVALAIRNYVAKGGFMFAMCSAPDSFDIALAAESIDIVSSELDGDGVSVDYQEKLDFSKTLAFKDFKIDVNPYNYSKSSIDISPIISGTSIQGKDNDFFSLFEFSAKYDPVPTMLTQNHRGVIQGFYGQTTAFNKAYIKETVCIMGEKKGTDEVKYIYGPYGNGQFCFYGGHDPEDYQHLVGEEPTNINLYKNSPGYRLILNNVLFPAAKKKKQKT